MLVVFEKEIPLFGDVLVHHGGFESQADDFILRICDYID
jgi:hypothetical protein